jgi:hypothetical protein
MQQEFLPFHCAAEPAFDRLPLDDLQIHFSPEDLEIVAALFLGVVHRGIGILYQRFGILSVLRVHADTNAAIDIEIVTFDEMGQAERLKYLSGADSNVLAVGDLGKQDNEFIATLAAYGI